GARRFERPRDRPTAESLQRAFEPLKLFPALSHARDRVVGLLSDDPVDESELVAAIESDPALALAVVTAACRHPTASLDVAGVPPAVEALSHEELGSVVSQVPVFDFFQRTRSEGAFVEGFRLHALMTQRSADRIHAQAGVGDLDKLRVAALLHDIGKFVLLRRHDQYARLLLLRANPEQRMLLEFRQFKMDHALAGGMLIRTLGLPASLATIIERHHAADAGGEAGVIRLADMFANFATGNAIDHEAFTEPGAAGGLTAADLRHLLARLPQPRRPALPRGGAPAPPGPESSTGGTNPYVVGPPSVSSQPSGHPRPPHPGVTTTPGGAPGSPPRSGLADVPPAYLRVYRAAAKAYSLDWRILAAIGKNESNHGRSTAAGVHSG